jgi:hypothetical protein
MTLALLKSLQHDEESRACTEAEKSRCTNDYRKVSRLENEAVLDRMAARLKARPKILDRRREMVEHPFGSIKQWMNQGAFLMKGLDNVRAEFSLTALVYNLRRALNILGVEAMMAAARGDGRRNIGQTDPPGPRSRHHRGHPAPECSNIAERSFRDLSPLRRSRFHTVR